MKNLLKLGERIVIDLAEIEYIEADDSFGMTLIGMKSKSKLRIDKLQYMMIYNNWIEFNKWKYSGFNEYKLENVLSSTPKSPMKVKSTCEDISTSDFWYDVFGDYLRPENLLKNQNDIKQVNDAIKTLIKFRFAVEPYIEKF